MTYSKISTTLRAISTEMQHQGLWQEEPPTAEQLASKLPFCVDTLTFSQWLQWVMFPKLIVINETRAQLPSKSNMAAMAEQAFKKERAPTDHLLTLIEQLDQQITGKI